MLDLKSLVQTLKRPGLLVRAARFGLDDYRRDPALRRLFRDEPVPTTGSALIKLIESEAACNEQRLAKSAEYKATHHIALLTAIMGEARLLEAAYSPAIAT